MQRDDPLLTLRQLAEALDVPYFKVQRAAARGLFPTYQLLNSRKYGRVSEVLAAMRGDTRPREAAFDENEGRHDD